MQEFIFKKDYRNIEALRKSFFKLAANTFDLKFENWYQQGCWGERYIPFSFVDGDQVIANASVNILELIIHGEKKKAIQIGTVMTHPDYRGKGLSASLMNKILEEYENKVDYMYLFANESVLDFYPKFGFKPVEEHLFSMNYTAKKSPEPANIQKLNVTNVEDLRLIHKFAIERLPVSQHFATDHAQGIFMYYCLNVFSDDIYYLENENVIVIYQKEDNHIELFDVVSLNEMNMKDILDKIADEDTEKITFHFTPDATDHIVLKSSITNEGLFVRTHGEHHYPVQVKHPITSIA
ncbi:MULTISPECIES: GNAT family N-acetyltransferase [Paenibacillus]|uniref:Acetyltransferase (GNAT) family protein n=1 Tax=Paenibacillus pabuli TaxID=1472 RepID=A0A855XPS0_9BACL|nr:MULTISPECIES: GNAT family N-acetyltransferase [Paenibacillus]PWW34711.1 acetyltransferase (GNAT) family protein [Paenibacillus pabuli]PXW01599.1 acetyltransferase (GNAT) family protein [Paenibacillus taichungensis]RAI88603.1 acetyltransferase (GNAT) family protein [Paenibacillus pabuli]